MPAPAPLDNRTSFGADVACVTVSYYSSGDLEKMLASLEAGTAKPAQTVIVNNAADDDLSRFVSEERHVRVLTTGENPGYGHAINDGVKLLGPEVGWILVSNPDVMFFPESLAIMLRAAHDAPEAGLIGPTIVDEAGSVYPSARELPSLRTGVGHALFANVWPSNPWSRRYRGEDRPRTGSRRETGWLSGSCLLIRREVFEQLGGFDESYFMYFEDVDLGLRVGKACWTNVYLEDATVVHVGATSTSRAPAAMLKAHHASAYQYLARKYSAWWLWPLRFVLKIALSIRARLTRHG